ncbi:cytochrome P450 [Trametes elegans]|nr:cytochrome P450 [Trametes elegans]
MLYPEVQKKAQAELDGIVGRDRLPDHGDREALVYVDALIKEVMRWHNIFHLSLPHYTIADDEFHGYLIPAGTTVMVNIWDILHDHKHYDRPYDIWPERYIRNGKLDHTVRDPESFTFGFGRRVCPGRHFARSALFIAVASVLHVFDVSLPVDENGEEIQVNYRPSGGLVSFPEDCRCTIKPRSAEAEALIVNEQSVHNEVVD